MQVGQLTVEHLGKFGTVKGGGHDSWAWEVAGVLHSVHHRLVWNERKQGNVPISKIAMLLKGVPENQLVTVDVYRDAEIEFAEE